MNYRHIFHAGNFADVFKHVILARILVNLRDKPAPFRVIDSHAGEGLYDLAGAEANRTGEWQEGIGRLVKATLPRPAAEQIAPYLDVVRARNRANALRFYPGSPLLARHLMRPQDRLIACEIMPAAASALAGHLRAAAHPRDPRACDTCAGDPRADAAIGTEAGAAPRLRNKAKVLQAKVLPIDGWTALGAFVPPKERRGLVIVDPPYEHPDDFGRLAAGIETAYRKWPTGVYFMWYPIKGRDGPDQLAMGLQRAAIGKALRVELTVAAAPAGLGACGIVVINPPWRLMTDIDIVLPALVNVLGRDAGRSAFMTWLGGAP